MEPDYREQLAAGLVAVNLAFDMQDRLLMTFQGWRVGIKCLGRGRWKVVMGMAMAMAMGNDADG